METQDHDPSTPTSNVMYIVEHEHTSQKGHKEHDNQQEGIEESKEYEAIRLQQEREEHNRDNDDHENDENGMSEERDRLELTQKEHTMSDDDGFQQQVIRTPNKEDQDGVSGNQTPQYTSTTTSLRRNANGSVSSVYSGNKIRHLKKNDGVPLWRKDIQYDFLKTVFEDEKPVFHKSSDGTFGHSFADIYLDAMAQSSKCSRILKEKLLTDRPAANNIAMVCLLVNVGRMNTTLNFFPEMKAQLRTYHSIPSLQLKSHQHPNAYKHLQDAPRLKSILKGATEDIEQPGTIEDIKAASIPRTNPVNLIFVLAQFAPKISELHFDVPRDFFDLVMKEQLSSISRATAFLWLMWWYLESEFSLKDALVNPYGPGRRSRISEVDDLPLLCPQFDYLTDEQAALENVDTLEEVEFGEMKQEERRLYVDGEIFPDYSGVPRRNKRLSASNHVFALHPASNDDAVSPARDVGSPAVTSSHSKPKAAASVMKQEESDSDQTVPESPTKVPQTSVKSMKANATRIKEAHPVLKSNPTSVPTHGTIHGDGLVGPVRRSRPQSTHQIALDQYRKDRVSHILDRGLREVHEQAAKRRKKVNSIALAAARLDLLGPAYDSEEEAHMTAAGRVGAAKMGIIMAGYRLGNKEENDFGEEMCAIAQGFRRLRRRLAKHDGDDPSSIDPSLNKTSRNIETSVENTMDLEVDEVKNNKAATGNPAEGEWSDASN